MPVLQGDQLDIAFEVKAVDSEGKFSGYASIFDVIDVQKDVVVKGAFENTLREQSPSGIKLLWQHRVDEPIGFFTRLQEDAVGLYVEGQLLLDVQRGKEAYELLKNGAVKGLSIGYSVRRSDVDYETGIRYIQEADLWEVSVVTFPANEHAGVTSVKGEMPQNIRQFEHFLRDNGFSRSQAKAIASKGFCYKSDSQPDGGVDALCYALDKCVTTLNQ